MALVCLQVLAEHKPSFQEMEPSDLDNEHFSRRLGGGRKAVREEGSIGGGAI